MARQPSLTLDKQLCFAVYSTAHAFNRFYKPLLDRIGLTYPQYLVMIVLWEGDGVTVKHLGERLMLDSGTLTPLLKRLETLGFVSRRRDAADERQVKVTLTEAGRALRAKASEIPPAVACGTQLDEAEFTALMGTLETLRARLLAASGRAPS
jgi:DNA-binding MarR family transcriptional regulator